MNLKSYFLFFLFLISLLFYQNVAAQNYSGDWYNDTDKFVFSIKHNGKTMKITNASGKSFTSTEYRETVTNYTFIFDFGKKMCELFMARNTDVEIYVSIFDGINDNIEYTIYKKAKKSKIPITDKEVTDDSSLVTDVLVKIQLEKNPETNKAYFGLCNDGYSALKIDISAEGLDKLNVHFEKGLGAIYDEEGESLGDRIALSGKTSVYFVPEMYIRNDKFTDAIQINKKMVDAAEEIIIFSYEDSAGKEKEYKLPIKILRPPVMLVHGFTGDKTTWDLFLTHFAAERFDAQSDDYDLKKSGRQSVEAQSKRLGTNIHRKKRLYSYQNIKLTKVDVVCHSMGGLMARYYAHGYKKYRDDVRKLIMIGTPNHGIEYWWRRAAGQSFAWLINKHRAMAKQVHYQSDFIKTLNEDEDIGQHLNPDVQYGNIYVIPGGDYVVSSSSAFLNGVEEYHMFDVVHSPAIPLGTAITEHLDVFDKVLDWLSADIERVPLENMQAEISSGQGEVFIGHYENMNPDYEELSLYPANVEIGELIKTGESRGVCVKFYLMDKFWGYLYVAPNSELYFGNFSPYMVNIQIYKGKAKFKSFKSGGGHFELTMMPKKYKHAQWYNFNPKAKVTGFETEFAVEVDKNHDLKVFILDGVALIDPNSYDAKENKSMFLDAGEALLLIKDDFDFEDIPESPWWNDLEEFDDPLGNQWWYWILAIGLIGFGLSLYAKKRKKRET